jgi:hypothetical protein
MVVASESAGEEGAGGTRKRWRMSDFVKINGTAVRTTGFYRRVIPHEGGADLTEIELVVIIRGSMANRAFKQLLSSPTLVVDSPLGSKWEQFGAKIEHVQVASSGEGEAAAFRYDINLRETPASADRRAVERVEEEPAAAPPKPSVAPTEQDDNPSGPADLSSVQLSSSTAVWGKAIKQLTAARSGRPEAPPEPPLTQTERAGIEAILVNLRLDALIDQLESAGVIRRGAVDATFKRFVRERFVEEATPLIGEKIAKRAERDLLG